jgi:hypothetical protein
MSYKLKIRIDNDAPAVADAKAQAWAEDVIKHINLTGRCVALVSTLTMLDALRVQVIQEAVAHDDVVIVFEDYNIEINEHGRLSDWPMGMLDYQGRLLETLLGI